MTQPMENAIALIGMACRLPVGNTPEQFWHALATGQEAVTFYSDEQLLANGASAAQLAEPKYVNAGVALPGRQLFDARFFNIAPREASLMDPQQRLLLETAYHALEHAGYAPDQSSQEIGVFVGADASSYYVRNVLPNAQVMAASDPVQLLYGNSGNSTQIAYKLNLKGPALDINTACSTSLVAIHQACRSLLMYECDMALAGGASVQASEPQGYLYRPDSILSADGHCRAFDEQASGTVPGQGVALVVLKRYEDALREGDRIEAIICGSAINNDGATKVGYTAPSVDGQAAVLRRALAMAGLHPEQVGYVECHGTGTALGDPIELTALNEVYGGPARPADRPCYLGSLKSNLGHLNSAAGAAGLIKAVLALRNRQLPASLNYRQLTSKVALQGLQVNDVLRDWPQAEQPLRAAVSSFGIGGTNAHVILQGAAPLPARQTEQGPWLLTLSAKTADGLARRKAALAAWLGEQPEVALADVCYSANVGRSQYVYRHAQRVDRLQACIAHLREERPARLAAPAPTDLVLVLRDSTELLTRAHALQQQCPAFASALQASAGQLPKPVQLDFAPASPLQHQQQAFVVLHAFTSLWLGWGLQPRRIVGDSLGERVAACHAGRLSVSDALDQLKTGNGDTTDCLSSLDSLGHAIGYCLLDAALLPWPASSKAAQSPACIRVEPGSGALAQMLEAAGELWQRGVTLNLAALHGERGHRLPLPGYPFDSVRHWIDAPGLVASPAPVLDKASRPALGGPCVSARSTLEQEIAGLWSELLGVSPIGVTDDFFDLGGHSLLATQLNARIHRLFGIELSLDDLFDHPTVEATVALLLRSEAAAMDNTH